MPELDTLLAEFSRHAPSLRQLGYRVRFDLTDLEESLLLDATSGRADISRAGPEEEADTVLRLSSEDLSRLAAGRLSPMLAFSTGRLRVEGSKGVAMKLASLLDEG